MPETLKFYMDVNIPGPVIKGLRAQGITVFTAQEDQNDETLDSDLLDRASALGCVLYTHDTDFLKIAHERLVTGEPFTGIIFSPQQPPRYAEVIEKLLVIAQCSTLEEWQNKQEHLSSF